MKLVALSIQRKDWGSDKGKLVGTIKLQLRESEVNMILSEEVANKIAALVASDVVRDAQEIANSMLHEVALFVDEVPQIEVLS